MSVIDSMSHHGVFFRVFSVGEQGPGLRLLGPAERLATVESRPVLGQGDPNLANFLVDDDVVRLVDFEDAGRSTEVYELANLVEHLANRATGFEAVIDAFDVRASDLLLCRRLVATFWFLLLAPGGGAHARNPPGTFEAQGRRLQALLDG